MIFCAPISSLELGEEVGAFFCICTHFYFSLPTEKFLRGQGEKYTRAEKGLITTILQKSILLIP